jgi:hypothetical protein
LPERREQGDGRFRLSDRPFATADSRLDIAMTAAPAHQIPNYRKMPIADAIVEA